MRDQSSELNHSACPYAEKSPEFLYTHSMSTGPRVPEPLCEPRSCPPFGISPSGTQAHTGVMKSRGGVHGALGDTYQGTSLYLKEPGKVSGNRQCWGYILKATEKLAGKTAHRNTAFSSSQSS